MCLSSDTTRAKDISKSSISPFCRCAELSCGRDKRYSKQRFKESHFPVFSLNTFTLRTKSYRGKYLSPSLLRNSLGKPDELYQELTIQFYVHGTFCKNRSKLRRHRSRELQTRVTFGPCFLSDVLTE